MASWAKPHGMTESPEWLNNLVIYEVATKAYTSPNGPESGTFDSLRERLAYLADLGITGIWLTGHSWSHPSHFYHIWTQYACYAPEVLDPSLGDAASFKRLIQEAHERGIKVFLDVITHGVMDDSPLVRQHPEWFKQGTWGMTDYDWAGGHKDLDEWWVDVWVRYVEEFGIDGFRLDVATYRYDLWAEIRRRAAESGHPIAIIHEEGPGVTGVSDFLQRGHRLSYHHLAGPRGLIRDHGLLRNAHAFIQDALHPSFNYRVTVEYEDGAKDTGDLAGDGTLAVVDEGRREEVVRFSSGAAYVSSRRMLRIAGFAKNKGVANVTVSDSVGVAEWSLRPYFEDFLLACEREGDGDVMRVSFQEKLPDGQWLSVQLSSHDDGWQGYPDDNPYVAQGSRFVFGYGFLLTPQIPVFMAGEEFDASFVPLPQMYPDLFGKQPGRGTWLYGSWVQWDQLREPQHAAMLEDVRRMLRIRREESDLIAPVRRGVAFDRLLPAEAVCVGAVGDDPLPVPYVYASSDRMILVAGNPYPDRDVELAFRLPLDRTAFADCRDFRVTDLWNDGEALLVDREEWPVRKWRIGRDKKARGGLLVLRIEPVERKGQA